MPSPGPRPRPRGEPSAERRFAAFLAPYSPEIRTLARAALARVRRQARGAVEIVYDNYNALVIGFGPTERASEAILSLALYPRWINLFFLQGALLAGPDRRLQGAGQRVRHIVVKDAATLDQPAVRRLISRALGAAPRLWEGRRRRMVIRSVSPAIVPAARSPSRFRPCRCRVSASPRTGRAGAPVSRCSGS